MRDEFGDGAPPPKTPLEAAHQQHRLLQELLRETRKTRSWMAWTFVLILAVFVMAFASGALDRHVVATIADPNAGPDGPDLTWDKDAKTFIDPTDHTQPPRQSPPGSPDE